MNEPLIDRLVNDLTPKKPLVNQALWGHCLICLAMIAGFIFVVLGFREDYVSAMQNGALFWKPGLFLLVWIGSVLWITDLSRPAGVIKKSRLIPFLCAGLILLWQCVIQMPRTPLESMGTVLGDSSAPYCICVIAGAGGLALVMVWKTWLSKTASPHPALLGFMAGLSAGALAGMVYALHCDRDAILYVTVCYGLPVLGLAVLGSVLGKRFLQW